MARTTITKVAALGPKGYAGVALLKAAGDVVNGNDAVMSGSDLVIANNTGVAPHTITIESAPDQHGRTRHITAESIAVGAIRIFGPFPPDGWSNGGRLNINVSNVAVLVDVVSLPLA